MGGTNCTPESVAQAMGGNERGDRYTKHMLFRAEIDYKMYPSCACAAYSSNSDRLVRACLIQSSMIL